MLALWTPVQITFAVLVPIVQLIGLYCAWRALLYTRTAQGAAAWVVSLTLQPFIAVPLYAVFGRRKFVGYTQARRDGDDELGSVADEVAEALRELHSDCEDEIPRLAALEKLAKLPFTRGNRAELLINGRATFDSIFDGLSRASDYALVQFFIIHDDELGSELKESLLACARRGVRVLLLFDEIGSHALPGSYLTELRAGGVDVRSFHTTRGKKNRFQVNFRNHRKVVLTDGKVAWVGGHNVGDEYMGKDPHFGPWRDTHMRLEGPAVQGVQLSFLEDWHWATKTVPTLNWKPARLTGGQVHALALGSGPADTLDTAELFFLHLIQSSERRIWITSPYFVPDGSVVQALKLAALRGVDVRVLLPSKPDHVLVYLSSFSYIEELHATGVRVFRYQPGFLHQKVVLVDDDIAVVGTANLDNRSFRLNFELSIVTHNTDFATSVETMLEADFAVSHELDLTHIKERSLLFRSAVQLARLAAPIQ
jgi:cardiolipin synthase